MAALTPRERLIVALDYPEGPPALALAARLAGRVGMMKVGLELFIAAGPSVVSELRAAGHAVFLDLKLHDIPNTVGSAARAAARLGATLLTVHAAGGREMLTAAREGAEAGAGPGEAPPAVIAVTVLTSLADSSLAEIGLVGTSEAAAERLARLSVDAGADGVVCSPKEAARLRAVLGPDALIVTPGVRPAGADRGDQARIATPAEAVAAGADYLVVGRPIRQASDPAAAADAIVAELASAT